MVELWAGAPLGVLANWRKVAKMRKFLVTATFVIAMGLGTVASPVAAAPNENANCIGQDFSGAARRNGRALGGLLSTVAQAEGGLGQFIGPSASNSSNCGS